jgi:hypothetical protein
LLLKFKRQGVIDIIIVGNAMEILNFKSPIYAEGKKHLAKHVDEILKF